MSNAWSPVMSMSFGFRSDFLFSSGLYICRRVAEHRLAGPVFGWFTPTRIGTWGWAVASRSGLWPVFFPGSVTTQLRGHRARRAGNVKTFLFAASSRTDGVEA
jgi:hypothetical protein